MNGNWNTANNQNVATFQALCHRINLGGNPRSYFTIPVIVSAGKDGIMGLNLPPATTLPWDMTAVTNDAVDNIYSFQVR